MHNIFVLQYAYFMPVHVSNTCAHRQEVKIALHSLRYHHTETLEWSKITKIHFYKYEQIVVKFMCDFFRWVRERERRPVIHGEIMLVRYGTVLRK